MALVNSYLLAYKQQMAVFLMKWTLMIPQLGFSNPKLKNKEASLR